MRILMLSQFYPPVIGGEEQHVRNLGAALAARGHEVSLATLWNDGLPETEIDAIAKRMRGRFAQTLELELADMPGFSARVNFPIWQQFIWLVNQLLGLPRHLSQHSGGMIISTTRMDEQVPIEATAMDGRFSVAIDDGKKIAVPVLRHRLSTNFQAQAEGMTSEDVIERLLKEVKEAEVAKFV